MRKRRPFRWPGFCSGARHLLGDELSVVQQIAEKLMVSDLLRLVHCLTVKAMGEVARAFMLQERAMSGSGDRWSDPTQRTP
jgi:hypothetical protein